MALKHNQASDKLKKNLGRRSSKEGLEKQGVLMSASMSDQLQQTAKQLDTQLKSDKLEKRFKHRSTSDKLKQKGIMKSGVKYT